MKPHIKELIPLTLLLTLAGCGGGANTTKLEVSKAFAMTNGYYAGGLIIYGESTNGNKFSVALDTNLETTLTLANGTWSFYAIGWDGGSNNYKFEGVKHCGATTQEIASSSTVNLTVNAAGCADPAFVSAIKPVNVIPSSCGAFYTYNDMTDVYSAADVSTPSGYCTNLPLQFKSPYGYYRVAAQEKRNGNVTTRYVSECKQINTDALYLPTGKIPLTIQKFKTSPECVSGVANNFPFPDGIDVGNDQNFEHKLFAGKLLLPSSKTRRGTSPFMNMLPRILCGASGSYSDCFADIDTLGMKASVPWENQGGQQQLLFKNTTATSCPLGLMDDSKYFNAANCEIRNNNIYAEISRNELTCQPATSLFTGVNDIYSANDKIYILKNDTPFDRVQVFNFKGQKQNDIVLNIADASKIAVSSNSIYALNPSGIKKFDFNGTILWSAPVTAYDLDVSPDESKVATAGISIGQIQVNTFDATTGSTLDTILGGSGAGPFRIAYDNGKIFGLDLANGKITQFTVNAGGDISTYGLIVTDVAAVNISRSISSPVGFYTMGSDTNVKRYTDTGTLLTTLTGAVGELFAITDPTSYHFFFASTGYLKMSYVSGANLFLYSTHAGECNDTYSVTSGGSSQTLSYKTKMNIAYHSSAEAMKFLGRRTISQLENVSYIIPDLYHDDEEIKSGGLLDLAQDDLSSTGIAGLLGKDYPTCDLLKAKVSDGSTVTASRNIYLPHRMENVQITLNVTKSTTALPSYICVDADPSGAGCPGGSVYDLDLALFVTHGLSNEKGRIRVVCNKKLGSFETLSNDEDNQVRRELRLWNTVSDAQARFERYEITDEGPNDYYASIAKLQKSATQDFLAREVSVHSNTAGFYSSQIELQRYTSSPSKLLTRREGYSETDIASFFSTHSSPAINTTFNGLAAPSCGDVGASIFSNHLAGCNFTGTILPGSEGLDLKMGTFNDGSQSALRAVFELTP